MCNLIDEADGTNNPDTLNGSAGAELIEAGAGRDIVIAQGGNDEIWTQSRATFDAINNQTDADGLPYIADTSEADLLAGSVGDDTVYGWAGADNLFGGSDRDLLVGGAGDDNLLGDRVFGVLDAQNWDIRRESVADAGGKRLVPGVLWRPEVIARNRQATLEICLFHWKFRRRITCRTRPKPNRGLPHPSTDRTPPPTTPTRSFA